jgi:hypothetical protein
MDRNPTPLISKPKRQALTSLNINTQLFKDPHMELNLSYNFDENIKLDCSQEYEDDLDRRVAGLISILEKEASAKSKSPEKPREDRGLLAN